MLQRLILAAAEAPAPDLLDAGHLVFAIEFKDLVEPVAGVDLVEVSHESLGLVDLVFHRLGQAAPSAEVGAEQLQLVDPREVDEDGVVWEEVMLHELAAGYSSVTSGFPAGLSAAGDAKIS